MLQDFYSVHTITNCVFIIPSDNLLEYDSEVSVGEYLSRVGNRRDVVTNLVYVTDLEAECHDVLGGVVDILTRLCRSCRRILGIRMRL